MRKIPTVLGEIEDSVLGVTLFHEHVACVNPAFYNAFGERQFSREKVIERAVKLFKQAKVEIGSNNLFVKTFDITKINEHFALFEYAEKELGC